MLFRSNINNNNSFHSAEDCVLLLMAKNIPPIINMNEPRTSAVMYQRLSIIEFRRSLNPVGGGGVCSSVDLSLNKSMYFLLLLDYVLLIVPS